MENPEVPLPSENVELPVILAAVSGQINDLIALGEQAGAKNRQICNTMEEIRMALDLEYGKVVTLRARLVSVSSYATNMVSTVEAMFRATDAQSHLTARADAERARNDLVAALEGRK